MKRISKTDYYLNIAREVAQRSTCLRRKYGAIIVKSDQIIATGYNGSPRGEINCCDTGTCERQRLNIAPGERYELCLSGNTVIKLLNGEYKTIKELAEKRESVWLYSVNTKTGRIEPALATNPRLTGKRNDLVEIFFDRGRSLICTADHPVLLRDCTYKAAGKLQPNDSVMPMYYSFINNGNNLYEHISNTIVTRRDGGRISRDGWMCNTFSTPTHRLVAEYFYGDIKGKISHHRDHNSLNNEPDNLKPYTVGEHTKHHYDNGDMPRPTKEQYLEIGKKAAQTRKDILAINPELKKKDQERRAASCTKQWQQDSFREQMLPICRDNFARGREKSNRDPRAIENRIIGKLLSGILEIEKRSGKAITANNYDELRLKFNPRHKLGEKGSHASPSNKVLKYFNSISEAIEAAHNWNHKVIKVEFLNRTEDVYDLSVPGNENFAIDLGDQSCIFVHNCKSIHAEMNACLHAGRNNAMGAIMYLVGIEAETGKLIPGEPCMMCARIIKQCGIDAVVTIPKEE